MHTAHPHTFPFNIWELTELLKHMREPQAKDLKHPRGFFMKGQLLFELLITNKFLNKPRRQSPEKEATGNGSQACFVTWTWNRN